MTEVDARLKVLGERYRDSLPAKRAGIERAWRSLVGSGHDVEHMEVLRRIVHRIAGSAPSYGHSAIGRLASEAEAELERLCSDARSAARPGTGLCALAPLIDRLLLALDEGMNAQDIEIPPGPTSPPS